jgi:RNA polymerase sigma-70 factor (ECF subfamily)
MTDSVAAHRQGSFSWEGSPMQGSSGFSTASSLLRRAQQADADAWRKLTDLYGPLVYHWCRRMGLDEHAAADVLQEVFTSVIGAIGRFDSRRIEGSFRGWLWRITCNKVRDVHRRRRAEQDAEGGTLAQRRLAELADPFTDHSHDPSDRVEIGSLVHRALNLIRAEFEPRTWEAFWRAAVEQQSTTDVAADLGLSAASVRQAKSRVLRRLRVAMGERTE